MIVVSTGEREQLDVERVPDPPAGLDLELVGVSVLALADRVAALEMRLADMDASRAAWTLDGAPAEIETVLRERSHRLTIAEMRDILAMQPGDTMILLAWSDGTPLASEIRRVR